MGSYIAQWSEYLQQETLGSIPGGYPGFFFSFSWRILMQMGWRICGALVQYGINTDTNGRVCGALVQFGCHQHRHEWMLRPHPSQAKPWTNMYMHTLLKACRLSYVQLLCKLERSNTKTKSMKLKLTGRLAATADLFIRCMFSIGRNSRILSSAPR